MKKINLDNVKQFLIKQFKFTVYEIALCGLLVALWVVSALPIFSVNLGFMHIGITYVWPILLGLTLKPALAILCSIIGDNLALLSSGTGFSQWMIEYAVIAPVIVLIAFFFKKLIQSKHEITWWIMVGIANSAIFVGTLATMVVERNFKFVSKNASDRVFDFTTGAAQIVTWSMYALVTLVSIVLITLYLISKKTDHIGKLQLKEQTLRQLISFYSLATIIIVVTIWIWGPFAQIRYLNQYVSIKAPHSYKEYDLFLIPRILKTPLSLALYITFVIPIYKTHELTQRRISHENRW